MHGLVLGAVCGWRPGVLGLVLDMICGWMDGVLGLAPDIVWCMLPERCRASRLFVSTAVAMGEGNYEWRRACRRDIGPDYMAIVHKVRMPCGICDTTMLDTDARDRHKIDEAKS